MGDIVLAIDPQRDRAANLVSRMRAFAGELLEGKSIDLGFSAPAAGLEAAVGPNLRRQVLLIFKECIHNAARHSGCTRVDVDVRIDGARLRLTARDNGKGLPEGPAQQGLGLASMKRRAAGLGGTCTIESAPAKGTTVTLDVPIR